MNMFKVIGIAVSVGGFALTLLGNWASEKQQKKDMDEMIEEKFNKRFGKASDE